MKKSLFFAAALLILAACTREMDVNTPAGDLTITARTETAPDTRTVVEGETHVYWEPGDEIAVFTAGKSGKFTTDLSASAASATFNGTLGADAWTEGMDIWAVYPYSHDSFFSDGTITTVLPSEQVARAGSFGKDMNLAIAHSTAPELQFYNVGGGVRFSLSQDGITEVMLEGLKKEVLAGKVKVGFQDGKPVIQEVTDGKTSITITPPEGEAFQKGKWYYIVVIPGAIEAGFTFHFKKASDPDLVMPSTEYPMTVTIKRGIYGKLTQIDKGPGASNPVPEAIDLGLPSGLKWASFNVGASKPEDAGDYYAWAEIEPYYSGLDPLTWKEGKEDGYWYTSYKCLNENLEFTKYITDGKMVPDPEDDVAHVKYGGKWRMPTDAEWTELREKCTWTWTMQGDIMGYLVTASNDNSIFIPAVGAWYMTERQAVGTYGYYWSANLDPNRPGCAWDVSFGSGFVARNSTDVAIWYGLSIRPVYGDPKSDNSEMPIPEPVDLGLPSGLKWASFNLGASKSEEYGDYYAWGEIEPYYYSLNPLSWNEGKEAGYAWPSYKWCMGSGTTLTKYCSDSSYGYNGFMDNNIVLDLEDDAAFQTLGDNWRMPTIKEWAELKSSCSWDWTSINGVFGRKVTGPNGNSIFLPAAGIISDTSRDYSGLIGMYWSSSYATRRIMDPSSDLPDIPGDAWILYFAEQGYPYWDMSSQRCIGYAIRPVSE